MINKQKLFSYFEKINYNLEDELDKTKKECQK